MKNENGITLIALIITIIVMLILVGVTINVALNGGLFEKAKNAAIQTELEQIKEQLVLAKAEIIADNNGNIPSDYGIALSDLELPDSIKTKYADKLIISQNGTLYYTDKATATDIVYFENAGIGKLEETTRNTIEYYVGRNENDSELIEGVYVVNYENSNMKFYMPDDNETLISVGGVDDVTFIEAPFTIELDSSQTTISAGIKIVAEIAGQSIDVAYISGQKLYISEEGKFSVENGYVSLDTSFDTSLLPS